MQYAVIEISGQRRLVDANELQALETHQDAITDAVEDEDSMPLKVVYGGYKVQPELSGNADAAVLDMARSRGYQLGYIDGGLCRAIELCDFIAFEPQRRGHALDIPFAALIRTHVAMPSKDRQAVSAFLRYAQMSPATNILNRPGIFAFKGEERRLGGVAVTHQNWRTFIDQSRAVRAAQNAW